MRTARDEVRWAPRVKPHEVRRLYETDARGIVDEEQIDEVGYGLYARCLGILRVAEAVEHGLVRCPRCERQGEESLIERSGDWTETLTCPRCGWELTWLEYRATFRRKQLSVGGARAAFERFVRDFPRARTPQQKMLAIDQVIHEFHYNLMKQVVLPTRAVAVNLIDGNLTEVLRFLDQLTFGESSSAGLGPAHEAWRENLGRVPWGTGLDEDAEPGEG